MNRMFQVIIGSLTYVNFYLTLSEILMLIIIFFINLHLKMKKKDSSNFALVILVHHTIEQGLKISYKIVIFSFLCLNHCYMIWYHYIMHDQINETFVLMLLHILVLFTYMLLRLKKDNCTMCWLWKCHHYFKVTNLF